jgi:mRNA-degrading endonuclease RelE of RelBE toxin-antitoxin system
MQVYLSKRAKKILQQLKGAAALERLLAALDEIQISPTRGRHIKSLTDVPKGYRKRVGRYCILYTFHAQEDCIRVWIIDMEKDTKKDYQQWLGYLLNQL